MVLKNVPKNQLGEGTVQKEGEIVGTVTLDAIPGEGAWLAKNLVTGVAYRFNSAAAAYQWLDSLFKENSN